MALTTHYDQGRAAFLSERYDEAVAEFEAALSDEPSSPSYLRSLAFAYLACRQPDRAEGPARRAAELEPGHPEGHFAVGSVLAALHRHREAIEELDATLRIQPHHVPARRQLVQSLCQAGHQHVDTQPDFAHYAFDRALKLDRNNPDVVAAVLMFLHQHYDVHRAVRLYRDLPEALRQAPPVAAVHARLEADPEGARLLQKAGDAPKPQTPAQAQAVVQMGPKTVPCPNCRQPIMEWAAICPHCQFKNRATGTFASMTDTGPNYDWKEIAYYIVSVLWMVPAVIGIISVLRLPQTAGLEGFRNFAIAMNALQLFLGLGLLTKIGVVMLVVRYFSYLTLLTSTFGMLFGFMTGRPLEGLVNLLTLGFTCFLLYLIHYMED